MTSMTMPAMEHSAPDAMESVPPLDAVPVRNHLLGALAKSELAELQPYLETVHLDGPAPIVGPQSVRYVYFPETAIVRLVSTLHEGRATDVGTVGREGMAGLSVLLDGPGAESSIHAFVQVPGIARRMDAQLFMVLAGVPGPFHDVVLKYTHALLTHSMHRATCVGTHLLEERCACWLLMARDRVDGSQLPITHLSLSRALGVRRSGVTLVMRSFKERGLVRYRRGSVEIVDARALERAACPCYGIAKKQYARVMAPAA